MSWSYLILCSKPTGIFPLCSRAVCRANWKWFDTGHNWPPAFIGWVALSSMFVVRLSSRIRDTSSHLHFMMFQTIQTIYFLWGYDPGNMSVSTYAELSPVYCCLVFKSCFYVTWRSNFCLWSPFVQALRQSAFSCTHSTSLSPSLWRIKNIKMKVKEGWPCEKI